MKHPMPGKLIASVLLVLFAATAGCNDDDEKQCTLIGCENGINLNFEDADGKPITTFKGTITLADKKISVECKPGTDTHGPEYSCNQNQVFLRAIDAEEFDVYIYETSDPNFGFSDPVTVKYEPLYPNGKECGEVCKQASKTLVMAPIGIVD